MKSWKAADFLAVATALVLTSFMLGNRLVDHMQYEHETDAVSANVFAIADAVGEYHEHTGQWFPNKTDGTPIGLYPDPFSDNVPDYQGVKQEWFRRENNGGIVLQLVRFDPAHTAYTHLFETRTQKHQPFLRILLDYGELEQVETEILKRLRVRLPEGTLAQVDDHYFVVDLRRVFNGE